MESDKPRATIVIDVGTTSGIYTYSLRIAKILSKYFHIELIHLWPRFKCITDIPKVLKGFARSSVLIFAHIAYAGLPSFIPVLLLSLLTKRKIVLVIHDIHIPCNKVSLKILNILRGVLLLKFSTVIPAFNSINTFVRVRAFNRSIVDRAVVVYPFLLENLPGSTFVQEKKPYILVFCKFEKILLNLDLLSRILKTYCNLINQSKVKIGLIIAGYATEKERKQFIEFLKALIRKDRIPESCISNIKVMFNIPEKLKQDLIRNALIILYPSRSEGLGMPIVETLESGTLLFAPRRTAMRELLPELFNLDRNCEELSNVLKLCILENRRIFEDILVKWYLKLRLIQLLNIRKLIKLLAH